MFRIIFPAMALTLVAACQTPPFSPDSPLTPVPVDSTLVLHQQLIMPPQTVSLWFQNGRQMHPNDLDRYDPHCKFETLQMQDSAKTVEPDTFVVHKVTRWDDYAMQPVQLASSRFALGMGHDDGGPSHVNTTTEMFLRSARQPDVYRLICSQWEDPAATDHVTINQIRRALGETFTLHLQEKFTTENSA